MIFALIRTTIRKLFRKDIIMKLLNSRIISVAVIALFVSAGVFGQSSSNSVTASDRYVVSAKAGGVNFVYGSAGVIREAGTSGLLIKGDRLAIGDRVSTGANGRVEVLLNPGSYLRLGANSAFEFKTTSLDDLQIALGSGSALFEVFATKDFAVTVSTPNSSFRLIESGVYRIDVEQDGTGTIAVRKGKAELDDQLATVVKSGREGSLENGRVSVTKYKKSDVDELDGWSKDRAKELAKFSGSLQRDAMRTALMRSYMGRQWNMYSSFGLWVYDPLRRVNCFLPFGWGWGSPYGYGFGTSIYYYNLPPVVFYPPPGGGTPPVATIRDSKPGRLVDDPVRPPFVHVQGSSNATGANSMVKPGRADSANPTFGGEPVRSSGGFSTGPVSAPPSSPAPVVVESKPGRP